MTQTGDVNLSLSNFWNTFLLGAFGTTTLGVYNPQKVLIYQIKQTKTQFNLRPESRGECINAKITEKKITGNLLIFSVFFRGMVAVSWKFTFMRSNSAELKGTLMQMWKSSYIPVFIWKKYVEDFTFKQLLLFEICARKICEKFVYKYSETIEYVKN